MLSQNHEMLRDSHPKIIFGWLNWYLGCYMYHILSNSYFLFVNNITPSICEINSVFKGVDVECSYEFYIIK